MAFFPRACLFLLAGGLLFTSCSPSAAPAITPPPAEAARLLNALTENHRQHPFVSSESVSDFAIDGVGYFSVQDFENDNRRLYTRRGRFQRNERGQLVTPEGLYLDPAITLPDADADVFLSEGGAVWVQQKNGQYAEVGRLTLARFLRPEALKEVDGLSGYFEPEPDAVGPEFGQPAQNGYGLVLNKALEDNSQPLQALPESPCRASGTERTPTDNPLDWHIQGEGYFALMHPGTGERLYTRRARLQVNKFGQLATQHGYFLEPAITLPPVSDNDDRNDYGRAFVRIDADGTVWARTPTDAETKLGQVKLYIFDDPTVLRAYAFSRETILRAPEAVSATEVQAGENGAGTIQSGAYESCGSDLLNMPNGFYQDYVTGGL